LDDVKEILSYINDLVITIDDKYKINYCNSHIKKLTGKEPSKIIGRKCYSVLFNKIEPCKDCQIQTLINKKLPLDIVHDTINHRGFRKIFRSRFERLENGLFLEVLQDITEQKKLNEKMTHQTKELKAKNVILNIQKKEVEKKHLFISKVIDSINEGIMVVNPDYSINLINYKLKEFAITKYVDETKCYEIYGKSEPCNDCPYKDRTINKVLRKAGDRDLTIYLNGFEDKIVESVRDTTKELYLISEIRKQQKELEEKQRQMALLNQDLLTMNEKLKEAQKVIDEELKQVGAIQESLLPTEFPKAEGYDFGAFYTPADQAGGDYYDCIEMSNNYWGFTVADVSGHGIPAAVIMAITRAIMRSYTYDVISSSEAISMVNEILCENIYTNDFVTMFYLVMNLTNDEVNYASAGHNPLLLFKKSEMVVKKITAHGMFLGVFDEVEYEEGEFKMEKGDIAFMYTDGLNEAMNKSDEQYGYDRLISKIIMFHQEKCSDIIKYIMDDVKEFTEGRPFADDITIFVIKKEE
jgi:sigma-B regulation protein RsbU (phosphoserine phosphatase)